MKRKERQAQLKFLLALKSKKTHLNQNLSRENSASSGVTSANATLKSVIGLENYLCDTRDNAKEERKIAVKGNGREVLPTARKASNLCTATLILLLRVMSLNKGKIAQTISGKYDLVNEGPFPSHFS